MDIVRLPDLLSLMQPAQGPCVTILLPTHLPGPEEQQDAIRLRNVVDRAENLLAEDTLRSRVEKSAAAAPVCPSRRCRTPIRRRFGVCGGGEHQTAAGLPLAAV